jgi:hypothetical protein
MSSNDVQRCSIHSKAYQHVTRYLIYVVSRCDFLVNYCFKHDDIGVIVNSTMNDLQAEERADSGAVEAHAREVPISRPSNPSITARPSPEEKARFTLIARHVGLSESALVLRAIRLLIDRDEQWLARQPELRWDHIAASDRITIRLRPNDGLKIIRRATERGMKPATYISALVRAHIACSPPLPVAELSALKKSIAVLAGLGTLLANTSRHGIPSGSQGEVYREAIGRTRAEVAALERHIVDLAKAALIAWETRL